MFVIAITLALCLVIMVIGICWAVIFVTQPMKQAPNDREFISILQTLMIFLTGSLGGVLAGNGLKNKRKGNNTPEE
jgi:Na+/proline symporter